MKIPTQITFRNMEPSPAVEERIHTEVAKLETFYDRLMSCRVMVEIPHRHRARGNPCHIRIDLGVPGDELVIEREPSLHQVLQMTGQHTKTAETQGEHKDVYVAIRDAFRTARRQLQDYARRQRGVIKTHEPALRAGRVAQLYPAKDYGFLETPEGSEIYFHRNSVGQNAFDALLIGSQVEYVEQLGEKGAQATYVKPLDMAALATTVPLY